MQHDFLHPLTRTTDCFCRCCCCRRFAGESGWFCASTLKGYVMKRGEGSCRSKGSRIVFLSTSAPSLTHSLISSLSLLTFSLSLRFDADNTAAMPCRHKDMGECREKVNGHRVVPCQRIPCDLLTFRSLPPPPSLSSPVSPVSAVSARVCLSLELLSPHNQLSCSDAVLFAYLAPWSSLLPPHAALAAISSCACVMISVLIKLFLSPSLPLSLLLTHSRSSPPLLCDVLEFICVHALCACYVCMPWHALLLVRSSFT